MSTGSTPYLHKSCIQKDALDVVSRLLNKKYVCYLVGGCVRDLLIGIQPKDFDIATSATPQEVKKNVPYSYIIGKRFRLVLVRRGTHLFEVATFRKQNLVETVETDDEGEESKKVVQDDNVFGSPEEDALRRDFTINGLFYNPFSNKVIDHVNGLKDLKNYKISMIGDPEVRLQEDPIRILRAIRLAHKIHFTIEKNLLQAIQKTAYTIKDAALPRKREEILKFLKTKDPSHPFLTCFDNGVLEHLSPTLFELFKDKNKCHEFSYYLSQIRNFGLDDSKPLDLMTLFIYAYLNVKYTDEEMDQFNSTQLYDNEELTQFFRFEIGIFKLELEIAYKAITLIKKLKNFQAFQNKGSKKIIDTLKKDSFYLAYLIGLNDHQFSNEAANFWMDMYQEHIKDIKELDQKKLNRKKKRNMLR